MNDTKPSTTATPKAAREHARAQEAAAAAAIAYKPTIPACDAADRPDGVVARAMVSAETLGPGGYAARILERGTRLRFDDVEGDACLGLLAYNAEERWERLNVADTVKVQWQAYLGEGALLLSDMGRVLLSIVRDTCGGRHDTLCGASSRWSNLSKYGHGSNHGPYPNARERFALALAKFGMSKQDITANVNFFKRVDVGSAGELRFAATRSKAGDFVELRAEMRVLVVLANAPHVLDPRSEYVATPVRVRAWRGPVAPRDCPIRLATPERRRAFENVDEYYAGRETPTPV